MAFSDIASAMDFVNEHDIGSAWNPDGSETDQLCHCMDRMKVTFIWEELLGLRNRVYSLLSAGKQQSELGSVQVQSGRTEHQYNPDVIDVLLSVRHRDSTDPRDKIFGVLSLVQDWGSWMPIKADYSKDALQVFKEFAAQMIQSEYGSKTLLLARGADLPSGDLTGLPTWVPDWSKNGSGYDRYLMAVERQTFRSLSSQSALILGPTLALSCGLSKGKIAELSTAGALLHKSYGQAPSMKNHERFTQMLDSWRTFAGVENVLTFGGVLNRYLPVWEDRKKTEGWAGSGSYARLMTDLERSEYTVDFMPQILRYLDRFRKYQDVLRLMDSDEEAFYRTLIHDTYPLHLRQAQYHTEALCILRLLLIFYNAFADPDRFLTRMNSVVLTKMSETLELVQIFRKRLFRTESGKLGIGPQEMIAGDEIVLFEGVKSPFILRAVGTRLVVGKGEQSCYELVGQCYLDGLENESLDWQTGKEFYLQ